MDAALCETQAGPIMTWITKRLYRPMHNSSTHINDQVPGGHGNLQLPVKVHWCKEVGEKGEMQLATQCEE